MTQQINDSTVIAIRSVPRPRPSAVGAEPDATDATLTEYPEDAADAPVGGDPLAARDPSEEAKTPPLGDYSAPFGFVLNALINHSPRSVPLVIEDAAELGAVARALALVNGDGGFEAEPIAISMVEARLRLSGADDPVTAAAGIRALEVELLELATAALPDDLDLPEPLALELSSTSADALLLCLRVEAPAAEQLESALHDAACALLPTLSDLAGVCPSVRVTCRTIERIRVRCRIDVEHLINATLATDGSNDGARSTEHALFRATAALGAGGRDAAIAAAHNQMIESGVAAVALALGNAPGRVIADAERYAARQGSCRPLCTWRAAGDAVQGELELPLGITTHGRWRPPAARGAGPAVTPARDIGMLAACVGMASSVVALEDALRVRVRDERCALPPVRDPAAREPGAREPERPAPGRDPAPPSSELSVASA